VLKLFNDPFDFHPGRVNLLEFFRIIERCGHDIAELIQFRFVKETVYIGKIM